MTIRILHGDCRAVLPTLEAESVHSVVTDPPYHLTSIVKRFGKEGSAPAQFGKDGAFARASKGFMGKTWDGGDVAFQPETWRLVFNVLKPGGFLVAFGGTRTFHRMACAIEDAGFEVRDSILDIIASDARVQAFMATLNDEQLGAFAEIVNGLGLQGSLAWVFGSGFPKSLNVSYKLDQMAGVERDRPTHNGMSVFGGPGIQECSWCGKSKGGAEGNCRCQKNGAPVTDAAREWAGWGTALKPAFEPIILARKPLSESSVAANVLKHRCGALNIDASMVGKGVRVTTGNGKRERTDGYGMQGGIIGGSDLGRWPANVLLGDGSEEMLAAFPETTTGNITPYKSKSNGYDGGWGLNRENAHCGDSGSAARFFYCAKADSHDRAGSKHPTIKPVSLIEYLVRLITPPGGTVLDCFAGSGTTGEACMKLGVDCILIEQSAEYVNDIEHRIKRWSGLDAPLFTTTKQESLEQSPELPLFAEIADE